MMWKLSHDEKISFEHRCVTCFRTFSRIEHACRHLSYHGILVCTFCDVSFSSKSTCYTHTWPDSIITPSKSGISSTSVLTRRGKHRQTRRRRPPMPLKRVAASTATARNRSQRNISNWNRPAMTPTTTARSARDVAAISRRLRRDRKTSRDLNTAMSIACATVFLSLLQERTNSVDLITVNLTQRVRSSS